MEIPSRGELDHELAAKMEAQKKVASEMLGFDVSDSKDATLEKEMRFLGWINANGEYFKEVLDKNPDIWARISHGQAEYGDLRWIMDQLRDSYDLGEEAETEPNPTIDA